MRALALLILAGCAVAQVEEVRVLSRDSTRVGVAALIRTRDDHSAFVTAAHVVSMAPPNSVSVGPLSVRSIRIDDADIAVLTTAPVAAEPLRVRRERWVPQPGEPATIRTLRGDLRALMRPHDGEYHLSVQDGESIVSGDSGAPVIDAHGDLVAIVVASSEDRDRVAVAVPVSEMR